MMPDGWDREQHLAAAAIEFGKIRNAAEAAEGKMNSQMKSPFTASSVPCEAERQRVVQCYKAHSGAGGTLSDSGVIECYGMTQLYQQCANDQLAKHYQMVSTVLGDKHSSPTQGFLSGN